MKLDFLVPQYDEDDSIIKNLLDSINIQQNIDFNDISVIIVNDGSNVFLSEKLLNSYPFKINYYKEDHKGVSATRNSCLNHSNADYVMFCDADDMFYNACGVWLILREIKLEEFDALISVFIEETKNSLDNSPVYINHNNDTTFVHGKVYRRKYLIENDIKFNPNLTIHEDSYFNYLAQKCTTPNRIKYSPNSFYLWKWRDSSVCRHDPKYILKTYNKMLDSSSALVQELMKRGKGNEAEELVTAMIYDAYFTMNKKEWINQENKEYRDSTEKRFKKYYNDFNYIYNMIDENKKNQIIMIIKNRMFSEGLVMESITFHDWINKILNI